MSQNKPTYEGSTQFKNWRFSPERLLSVRGNLNAAAVAAIRNTFEVDEVSTISLRPHRVLNRIARIFNQRVIPRRSRGASPCQIVHYQDTPTMWSLPLPRGGRGYRNNLSQTLLSQKHRHGLAPQECHVRSSIHSSPPSDQPSVSRLTALFLATKTTNNPISLDSYTSNIPRTTTSDVLDLEFLVAQSLNFEFAVWHSHRALWGLWLDLQVRHPPISRFSSHALQVIVRCHGGPNVTGRVRDSAQACPRLTIH